METEVMLPSPAVDFNFDSNCTSPYLTAPSSPQRFAGFFHSAPNSPGRAAAAAALSSVPFTWEEKPGIPKLKESDAPDEEEFQDTEFAFDLIGHTNSVAAAADQLFDGGKIRPLKPPPKFNYDPNYKPLDLSPKSPRSPTRLIREAFSPRHRKLHKSPESDFDPFAAALEKTRLANSIRGRDRAIHTSKTPPGPRKTKPSRSLSPFRVSDLLFDPGPGSGDQNPPQASSASASIFSSSFWYKKWKIKDLLLFRSASESRASEKQQVKKYTLLRKARQDEDIRNASFRSTESAGSVSSRRRAASGPPPISAHELHYTVNRAVSEEMKKRTLLPYKQGLLGCLGFHPTGSEISRGLNPTGSLSRG